MKFDIRIIGESPFAEPKEQKKANMTTEFDFMRLSLQYGVPICIDAEKMEIIIDLTKKETDDAKAEQVDS